MSAADPSLDAWRGLVDLERLAAWMDERGRRPVPSRRPRGRREARRTSC
jgi:hypothetical protein